MKPQPFLFVGEICHSSPMAHPPPPKPAAFLEVHVKELTLAPPLLGLCAGYESGAWRAQQFARHLIEWLPEFALNWSDLRQAAAHNMVELMRRAATAVYKSAKYRKRGEFGELLLHAAIRQEFNSSPAVSKIFFKTAPNDTVKGFDAVHVVGTPGDLELWLGEVKFYDNVAAAIRDVASELKVHSAANYLRQEFALITPKLDAAWPHTAELRKLLHPNTSLDTIFKRLCIPVLLTYDSKCLDLHEKCTTKEFITDFRKELAAHHDSFSKKIGKLKIKVVLFLVPLSTKAKLLAELDGSLKTWQQL